MSSCGMRVKWGMLVFLLVVCAAAGSASAQKAAVGAFVTNAGGTGYSTGWGVGAEYWFSPRISGAVAYTTGKRDYGTTFLSATPVTLHENIHPLDAVLRWHFRGSNRWKPYVGAGAEHLEVSLYDASTGLFQRVSRTSPEVNGGVTFLITPSLGLDLDGKSIFHSSSIDGDDLRVSAGLSWRF
jgi:outer membrane protein W